MADTLVHADSHEHGHHAVDPGPQRYSMGSGTRTTLIGGVVLGLICLVLSFFFDETAHHTRFWSNWLHNGVFFMGISFMSLFLVAAKVLFYSGWHTVFKRVWEAYAQFLPVGIILMLPIVLGLYFGWHHIYHWSDTSAFATDKLLEAKSAFLNPIWYVAGAVLIPAVWYFVFAVRLRALSKDEDENGTGDFDQHKAMRKTAGIFLPIAAFSSAFVIWLLIMSVDAHWYSTLFAWYATASWLVSAVGLTILLLVFLKTLGYFGQVTTEHLHDLGKYLFAFSIFWTYLWFSQFMLIWYGNVGEETVYFQTRMEQFPVLFWANLGINFLIPFLVLMANVTKRKLGILSFVAIMCVFGHWLDFFQMLKPGIYETAMHAAHGADADAHGEDIHMDEAGHAVAAAGHDDHGNDHASGEHASTAGHGHDAIAPGFSMPGLIEVGSFIGFLSLFFFVALTALSKANLVPKHDPYLEESLHHHV
ncbi:MAG: hypothetical protein AB8F78_01090 [Saprospiraceae bacterium]